MEIGSAGECVCMWRRRGGGGERERERKRERERERESALAIINFHSLSTVSILYKSPTHFIMYMGGAWPLQHCTHSSSLTDVR